MTAAFAALPKHYYFETNYQCRTLPLGFWDSTLQHLAMFPSEWALVVVDYRTGCRGLHVELLVSLLVFYCHSLDSFDDIVNLWEVTANFLGAIVQQMIQAGYMEDLWV